MYYFYARVSTPSQRMERQTDAFIDFGKSQFGLSKKEVEENTYKEKYTGRKVIERPQFMELLSKVKTGDTIVFDSVSRMSRSAEEGVNLYLELFDKGINLIFLNERHIDTETYKSALSNSVELTGDIIDDVLNGINSYLKKLATKQIRLAFEQAQKEVDDLSDRTSKALQAKKRRGEPVGGQAQIGMKKKVKKAQPIKDLIYKYSKDFKGTNKDEDVIGIIKNKLKTSLSRNTYYKYKKELAEELRERETEQLVKTLQEKQPDTTE